MTKEERRKERATRKRKIKSHLKHKEIVQKEKKRASGIAMNDKFELKQLHKKAQKEKKVAKEDGESKRGGSKNEMKSAKFFSKLQEVAKDDKDRKDQKRKAKQEG